jgi:ABC-type lipoprotein export system ATPase subunit/catechol 2,3-dioxygenase-like lactoylglutathione lyase family enzyme
MTRRQPTLPIAGSHHLIRVHGARVNNLKDVNIDIPKRRLTVFTGISGSGKSSLVFGTIAAESQRLINETYSAFVQGFMPTLARPEVDVLEGLTTAIIVDQQRMGADPRSTVGTATDAHALLRILFSRLGRPHIGPPSAFSFNTPSVRASGAITVERGAAKAVRKSFTRLAGMCLRCEGMGSVSDMDLTQLFDDSKSLAEGAITIPGYTVDSFWTVRPYIESGILDPNKPIRNYTKKELHDFLHHEPIRVKVNGVNVTYEGLIPKLQRSFLSKDRETLQPQIRAFVDRAITFTACPECAGTRLSEGARSSRIGRTNIADACAMQISDLAEWVRGVKEPSVAPLLATLQHTLDSFAEIGLGYLSLERPAGTLSGGEAQRVKMVRHLGSSLTDVTYVFDEPTAGMHPHDVERMNNLLLRLRDKGNTVLVVEHEPETIAIADHVVDLGAGAAGGSICFEGTVSGLRASDTLTGRHLEDRAAFKQTLRMPTGALEIRGATAHNLRKVDVDIPLGVLVVITGVAGSGKSSLVHGSIPAGAGVVSMDQGAIRGSRRSNPATYTGLLDPIRKAFAKANRVDAALFSFNSEGACPNCNGIGVIYTDLAMMAGVATTCEECEGKRFEASVLRHHLGGRDISEVLAMSVTDAREFFGGGKAHPGRARHPRAPRRRRARLPQPRPAAHHPVRRRAAAPQAGHPHGREGRRLHPRRADHRPPPRRRGAAARPCRPDRRLRQVGHRHRASPGGHGPRRLDHRPRPRRRPRRRPDRLRGHTRRPRRRAFHPHRRAPPRPTSTRQESRSAGHRSGPRVTAMDISINSTFLPHNDPEESLAFYRDTLGFEVRNDVGYAGMRWVTVGPTGQPGTSIVLYPPFATPGITDDERRTIVEMMAKGTYAIIVLATPDLDGAFERLEASGAEVVQEPTEQPYGIRDCAIRDPAGNLIRISELR